jgi:chromosome segregation ATPase
LARSHRVAAAFGRPAKLVAIDVWQIRNSVPFSSGLPVSAELSQSSAASAPAHTVLADLETSHDEFEQFFGEVFDQLQSLSLELFARHKCLELSAQQQQAQEAVQAGQDEDSHELLDEMRAMRADVRELHEAAQGHLARLAAIAAQLAEAQSQAAERTTTEQVEQVEQVRAEARRREGQWQSERAALEAELERVRARAVELSDALAEQKRQSAQQQAELAGELRRMRSMLETICSQMSTSAAVPSPATSSGGQQPADPVLGSVLAQFEMLQHDLARRRASQSTT